MGLDTVELVMEFEDEFGISIPDEDAEKIQTLGQTVDYIVKILAGRGRSISGLCPSARRFYAMRRGLGVRFSVPRAQVRPSAEIGALIPAGPARARWGQFARESGLPRPPMSFFPTRRFPLPQITVAQLIRASRRSTEYFDASGVNVDAVWEKVRQIVSEQMGVDVSELHRRTHYINDLNCD